jgi:2-dehydro-3-deoxygalactonokinase
VDLAQKLVPVDLGGGRQAHIVPGLTCEPSRGAVDVMRGEETLSFGAGVETGLVCLPGTHSKWVEMRDGRIQRFGSFMTGEMYGLLRHHSMVGRPALEPEDAAGFQEGLEKAARDEAHAGLLHLLFGARAATVAGRLDPHKLAPLISGLLTGEEVRGALALLGRPETMTIVAGAPRADLYIRALAAMGVKTVVVEPQAALIRGIVRIATVLA